MTERRRRDRIHDQRPPSRHMRSLLRQSWFAVHRLLRRLADANRMYPGEVAEMHRTVALCRRAMARDPRPDWLAALETAVPPGPQEAIAALNLMLERLAAIQIDWERRLVAHGIDPRWPVSGA